MIANNENGGGVDEKPKRGRKKKQEELPAMTGLGVVKFQSDELDDAIEAYLKERDKRMELTPKEVAAKTALMALMHAKNVTEYEFEERTIKLVSKGETIKVSKPEEPDEDVNVE